MVVAVVQVLDYEGNEARVRLGAVNLTVPRGVLQNRGGHTTLQLESVEPGRRPEFRVVKVQDHPHGVQVHESQVKE